MERRPGGLFMPPGAAMEFEEYAYCSFNAFPAFSWLS